jgi:serine/threonine-protein kinase
MVAGISIERRPWDMQRAEPLAPRAPEEPPAPVARPCSLPDDLLDQALFRLTYLAAIVGGLSLLSFGSAAALGVFFPSFTVSAVALAARGVMVVSAASLFFVVRFTAVDRQIKAKLGLLFEVIGAFGVAVLEVAVYSSIDFPLGAVSSVCLWILVFRLIVPARSPDAFLVAFFSAAGVPFALWLSGTLGYGEVSWAIATLQTKAAFGTALIAWLGSRGIYRMGTAVAEARKLGSYELQEPLGEGGMGRIFRASHGLLKRPAAVKVVRPETLAGTDPGGRDLVLQRFEREAQAIAQLQSAHTVTLFDFGKTGDGGFYYVMELLDGVDLERLVERFGPLGPERAAYLLDQVAHSLAEAHDLGLVHRDIKPSNVLACRKGPDVDYIKVLDFGLVKDVGPLTGSDANLTRDGSTPGTPAFMAPEVALGSARIDARADVYALGCLAYWLLTGELVFDGGTPISIIAKHVNDDPVPVSQRTELPIPAGLERLVMDCLAKDPEQRPRDAGEVRRRLAAVRLDGIWDQARAQRWWDVHRPS